MDVENSSEFRTTNSGRPMPVPLTWTIGEGL